MKTISRPFNPINLKKKPSESLNVAISMSTYNCERWIDQTINSLTQQTWKSWVLFIHDDCSTDETVQIIRKAMINEGRIRLHVNKTNQGPYVNHNKSRALALAPRNFDYFTLIDHDDIAHPEWLERNIQIIKSSSACGIRPINQRVDESNEQVLYSYPAVNQTFWSMEIIQRLGGYNLHVGIPDTEFMLRAERYCELTRNWICLSLFNNHRMRVHSRNVSGHYTSKMKEELNNIDYTNATLDQLEITL